MASAHGKTITNRVGGRTVPRDVARQRTRAHCPRRCGPPTAAGLARTHRGNLRLAAACLRPQGYFTEISRYLHLNPVRAKLVADPGQWKWSSYAGYRDARRASPRVSYGRVLGEFGSGAEARRGYCRFVRAGVAEPPRCPWRDALGGLPVGSQSFAMRVRRLLGGRPADREVPQLERLRDRPGKNCELRHGLYYGGWSRSPPPWRRNAAGRFPNCSAIYGLLGTTYGSRQGRCATAVARWASGPTNCSRLAS